MDISPYLEGGGSRAVASFRFGWQDFWIVDLQCRARSPQPVWDISPYLEGGGSRTVVPSTVGRPCSCRRHAPGG